MANTTKDIDTRCRYKGPARSVAMAAATKIFAGALVAIDAAGNAVKGDDTAGKIIIGRAGATVDNSAGAAGDLRISVESGVFEYTGSAAVIAAGRAVLSTNGGKLFADDDQTLGLAADVANNIVAGRAHEIDVETGKVWIAVGLEIF